MQEQAAEQAAVVQKAAEAEQLRLRAASGTYGGGSGPLRDTAGRPITDFNQVSLDHSAHQGLYHLKHCSLQRLAWPVLHNGQY